MNRAECLALLVGLRGAHALAGWTLGTDGVLAVCGALAAYVFCELVGYAYQRQRRFRDHLEMVYCLRCCKMPRSRRRHHSRSRTRSRSHSHDRDREAKRRKIDSYDSPHHRRSVSSEPEDRIDDDVEVIVPGDETSPKEEQPKTPGQDESDLSMVTADESIAVSSEKDSQEESIMKTPTSSLKQKPRRLTPKQVEKRKEAEKKRQERLEEKQRKLEESNRIKQQKEEEKQRAKEEKLREKEKILKEKEEKKKEKELKRKEKEEKNEEKIKEKMKMEEAKVKAAAEFVKFFKKIPDDDAGGDKLEMPIKGAIAFKPFQSKVDMHLAPTTRLELSPERKQSLDNLLAEQKSDCSLYLIELKSGKETGKFRKTYPKQDDDDDDSDDIIIIMDTVERAKNKVKRMRAKFLQFKENQRPAYYGTHRKKSSKIRPRRPFGRDDDLLDYEVDSDEEWEEEPDGESLKGTDDEDEDKENETVDDYDVDNDFLVPHGHLSEDEIDDEEEEKKSFDPEVHKAKLKLLKNEFDAERKSKMLRIRPSVVGTYFLGNVKDDIAQLNVDKYLTQFGFVGANRKVEIKDRSTFENTAVGKRKSRPLSQEYLPAFLKFVDGSSLKGKVLVKRFIAGLEENGIDVAVSQMAMGKQLRKYAEWKGKEDEGVKKKSWTVKEEYRQEFNLDLSEKEGGGKAAGDSCIASLSL